MVIRRPAVSKFWSWAGARPGESHQGHERRGMWPAVHIPMLPVTLVIVGSAGRWGVRSVGLTPVLPLTISLITTGRPVHEERGPVVILLPPGWWLIEPGGTIIIWSPSVAAWLIPNLFFPILFFSTLRVLFSVLISLWSLHRLHSWSSRWWFR